MDRTGRTVHVASICVASVPELWLCFAVPKFIVCNSGRCTYYCSTELQTDRPLMPFPVCFATVTRAPIELPEQVLVMIVSRALDLIPATAGADGADERSLYAGMMRGIGSASKLLRHLVKGVLMGDELAWLRVPGAGAAAECMSCFPRALSLRIVGDGRSGDIGAVLGSRSVVRLAIANNRMMRGCDGLGQLVGLRALYIEECGRLHDAARRRCLR